MNVTSLNYYAQLLIELVRIVLICIYYNKYTKYIFLNCSQRVQNIIKKLKKSNNNNTNTNTNNNTHNNNNNMDEQQQEEENREERNAALEQIVEEQRDIQALANRIHAFIEHAEAVMREMDEGDDSDILEESAEEEDDLMDIDDSDMDLLDDESSDDSEDYTSTLNPNLYYCCPLKIQKCHYATELVPCARSGHRVIADEANLYSLGGYNPRSDLGTEASLLFQELWRYNFATSSWHLILDGETTTNMPTELASNALIMHNNKLITHGGTGFPFGELCSNDCYVYTTGSKPTVSCMKVTGELPTAQYGPGIVIHDDYLYTIGGTTGFDYSCDVYRLNLKTRVWERVYISRPEMRDDPEGRYRHEVVYDGTHIYVLGGGTSHSVYDLKRLPAFNLKLNRWDYIKTLPDRSVITRPRSDGYPRPRKCFSCVQHTNAHGDIEAFITGGLQVVLDNFGEHVPFQGDVRSYFGDIWRLNLRTKQWTSIRTASLPKPLYFHSAAHSGNGCMWIFGGIEYSLKDNHRRNYMFKMWMTVPRLSEMCWEAITFYNQRLNQYDRSTLMGVGLPERFVQRIAALKDKPRQTVAPIISTSV